MRKLWLILLLLLLPTVGWAETTVYGLDTTITGDQVFEGARIIDDDSTECFQVRKDGDAGDIFTVDCTSGDVYTVAWTDYGGTSTVVGFSGTPTVNIWYKKIGNLVFLHWNISGTSNATNFTFTLPYTSINSTGFIVSAAVRTVDGGVVSTGGGFSDLDPNTNLVTVYYAWIGTTWTNSGAKEARGQFWYEAQ